MKKSLRVQKTFCKKFSRFFPLFIIVTLLLASSLILYFSGFTTGGKATALEEINLKLQQKKAELEVLEKSMKDLAERLKQNAYDQARVEKENGRSSDQYKELSDLSDSIIEDQYPLLHDSISDAKSEIQKLERKSEILQLTNEAEKQAAKAAEKRAAEKRDEEERTALAKLVAEKELKKESEKEWSTTCDCSTGKIFTLFLQGPDHNGAFEQNTCVPLLMDLFSKHGETLQESKSLNNKFKVTYGTGFVSIDAHELKTEDERKMTAPLFSDELDKAIQFLESKVYLRAETAKFRKEKRPCDKVVIYLAAHGSEDEGFFGASGIPLFGLKLMDMMTYLNKDFLTPFYVSAYACHSGSLLIELQKWAAIQKKPISFAGVSQCRADESKNNVGFDCDVLVNLANKQSLRTAFKNARDKAKERQQSYTDLIANPQLATAGDGDAANPFDCKPQCPSKK